MDGASRLAPGNGPTVAWSGCATGRCSTATSTTHSRAPARVVSRGLPRSPRRQPPREADGPLPQPARVGRERLGLLQPLDARPEGSPHPGNDGARTGGPEQPAVLRRANHCCASAPAAGRRPTSRLPPDSTRPPRNRRRALLAGAYDPDSGFFYDVRWRTGERVTDRPTLAAAAPLYFGLATPEQGRAVAARLQRDFLKPGGFVTTLVSLRAAVGRAERLAAARVAQHRGGSPIRPRRSGQSARTRWLALNRRTYPVGPEDDREIRRRGPASRRAAGGEYPHAGRLWVDRWSRAGAGGRGVRGGGLAGRSCAVPGARRPAELRLARSPWATRPPCAVPSDRVTVHGTGHAAAGPAYQARTNAVIMLERSHPLRGTAPQNLGVRNRDVASPGTSPSAVVFRGLNSLFPRSIPSTHHASR